AVAQKIEAVLRAGLTHAASTSLKAAWFNAYRSLVTTPAGVEWLRGVWRHDVKIDGLPLAEADEADIALDLAVRDVADAAAILDGQVARFTNPDRKARFLFVRPALASDKAMRDQFFAGLANADNRRHEAWVLDAMRYLNHPLRAGSSKAYVHDALDLVREIQ